MGKESSNFLAIVLGLELHHLIMSALRGRGGRLKRKKKNIFQFIQKSAFDYNTCLLGVRNKESRIRGTIHDPTSLKHRKGEGWIAADVVLNIVI